MKLHIALVVTVFILNTLFLTHIYAAQPNVSLEAKMNTLQQKRELRERKRLALKAEKEQKSAAKPKKEKKHKFAWD